VITEIRDNTCSQTKTETNKRQGAHLVQWATGSRSVEAVRYDYELMKERMWKRWVLSLEWKTDGVIDGEGKGDDCDEVICAGWGRPGVFRAIDLLEIDES